MSIAKFLHKEASVKPPNGADLPSIFGTRLRGNICAAPLTDLVNQSLSGKKTRAFSQMRSFSDQDNRVTRLSEQLAEIEQRLIPTGLHIFGRAAELKEKADLLRMVASCSGRSNDATMRSRSAISLN